jgi:hypothetical protein
MQGVGDPLTCPLVRNYYLGQRESSLPILMSEFRERLGLETIPPPVIFAKRPAPGLPDRLTVMVRNHEIEVWSRAIVLKSAHESLN